MAHYRDTVDSSMEAEQLFDYMADFSNAEQWDPGTKSAKRLDDGKIGEGSRFELVVEFMGRENPFTYEIVEYDRPNKVAVQAESDASTLLDTMSIEKGLGSGTVLTYDAKLGLKGVRKALNPVMSVLFKRLCEKGRQGLERELNPGGGAS